MNNEQFEKKLKLCLQKLNKEIDKDWIEIVQELGLDVSSDHLRKTAYGLKEYDDYIKSKTPEMIGKEEYEKLLEKELEIKKEKVKLQDMRNLVNKQVRDVSRKENLGEILEEKMEQLNMQPRMINDEVMLYSNKEKQGILVISDVHYGETVDIFLNKYNSDICKQRMAYLIDKTIEYCKLNSINVLNVFLLGDLISNEHYTCIRLFNRENMIEQIIGVSELLSESIMKLAQNVKMVTIGITSGNHCRVHKKGENLNKDNYTTLIKEFLTLRLANVSNVTFMENKYDDEVITANICGLNIVGTHGDKTDKKQATYQLSSLLNQKIDILLVGHFHEMATQVHHETTVIRNGSVVGSNEYSRNMNLHTRPCQRMLIVSENGCDCIYNIFLDKINN